MPILEAVWNRQSSARGQTGVDFVIGVAIFLLTTAFVFQFMPGVLAPFGESTVTPLHGDRVVDDLVYDSLAEGSAPGVLSEADTLAFFQATDTGVRATIGLTDDRYEYNISLQATETDGTRVPLYNASGLISQSSGDRLATGDPVPDTYGSVSTVSRHVRIADIDAVMVVRIW